MDAEVKEVERGGGEEELLEEESWQVKEHAAATTTSADLVSDEAVKMARGELTQNAMVGDLENDVWGTEVI